MKLDHDLNTGSYERGGNVLIDGGSSVGTVMSRMENDRRSLDGEDIGEFNYDIDINVKEDDDDKKKKVTINENHVERSQSGQNQNRGSILKNSKGAEGEAEETEEQKKLRLLEEKRARRKARRAKLNEINKKPRKRPRHIPNNFDLKELETNTYSKLHTARSRSRRDQDNEDRIVTSRVSKKQKKLINKSLNRNKKKKRAKKKKPKMKKIVVIKKVIYVDEEDTPVITFEDDLREGSNTYRSIYASQQSKPKKRKRRKVKNPVYQEVNPFYTEEADQREGYYTARAQPRSRYVDQVVRKWNDSYHLLRSSSLEDIQDRYKSEILTPVHLIKSSDNGEYLDACQPTNVGSARSSKRGKKKQAYFLSTDEFYRSIQSNPKRYQTPQTAKTRATYNSESSKKTTPFGQIFKNSSLKKKTKQDKLNPAKEMLFGLNRALVDNSRRLDTIGTDYVIDRATGERKDLRTSDLQELISPKRRRIEPNLEDQYMSAKESWRKKERDREREMRSNPVRQFEELEELGDLVHRLGELRAPKRKGKKVRYFNPEKRERRLRNKESDREWEQYGGSLPMKGWRELYDEMNYKYGLEY
jgi:hypothetical protein